jgi:hypothetical protein
VHVPQHRLLLGYAAMAADDYAKAWEHFSAVDGDPKAKTAWLAWASALAEGRPESATALVFKADALARRGRYQEALDALDRAIKLDGKLALAYDLRGLVRTVLLDYPAAAQDLDKAVDLAPRMANARFNRAVLHLLSGDSEAATKGLTGLLKDHPAFFLARNARGVAHLLAGRYGEALQDFDQVEKEMPTFAEAQANKRLTGMLRARGLFAVDIEKMAALSPKGILGSRATNLYYAGAGINSPDGGQTFQLARQQAGPQAVVITIREKDYLAKGLTPGSPSLGKAIAQEVALKTLEAKAQGCNVIISAVPNLENYKTQLATEYMFSAKEWNASKAFMGTAMEAALSGFRSAEPNGRATANVHSFHGDAFAATKGPCYDAVNAFKIRTGGGVDDSFAKRCADYNKDSKTVNLFTGCGDIGSLGNAATKATADNLAQRGLVNSYFDKVNHGHGIALGNSVYDLRTKDGTKTVVGDAFTLTNLGGLVHTGHPLPTIERSGVFLRLGKADTDVTATKTADLQSLLQGGRAVPAAAAPATGEEPSLSYPFLVFNHAPGAPPPTPESAR